jgi:cytochrome oxidase assembly protein ShyY1
VRALLRPRWLIAHAVVLAIVLLFVNLGLWQLRRLDERRRANQILTSRTALPIVPLELLAPTPPDERAYRRVTVTGTYDTTHEVILLNRARNDIAGHHVVTPLITAGGTALLVDRGWVPYDLDEPPIAEAAPPPGTVEVTGVLVRSETRGRLGPKDIGEGRLAQVFRVDVDRLREQLPYPVYPLWLLAAERLPPGREIPAPAVLPEPTEGPHLSYAIQWFSFAAAGLGVYIAASRRRVSSALSSSLLDP